MVSDPRAEHYDAVLAATQHVQEALDALKTAMTLVEGNIGFVEKVTGNAPEPNTIRWNVRYGAFMMRRQIRETTWTGLRMIDDLQIIRDSI